MNGWGIDQDQPFGIFQDPIQKIKKMKRFLLIVSGLVFYSLSFAKDLPEMIIGTKNTLPGITFVFEGAIKDDVAPLDIFLSEARSDIHLEALANWNEQAPRGAVKGGFVAYLNVNALIINQKTNKQLSVILPPHMNMSDNLHYASNTPLPGKKSDLYTVIFSIKPPKDGEMGMHFDWREEVGARIMDPQQFEFKDLNFLEIANATRR